jgi:biopolymer transport protein TolR
VAASPRRPANTMPQLSKNTQSTLSEINMVPFIDVVLVLLIIFMITAPILQSGIEVDVPKTKTVKEINEPRLVITIDKNQLVYLADVPVNINQLGSKVRAQLKKPQDSVFLRADETIPFGTFAKVIDALRQSGVSNISIVTEPLSERARTR